VEEEVQGKAIDSRLMRRLLTYAWPYRMWVLLALLCLLVNSVVQILGPQLTRLAVDRYLAPAANREPSILDPYLAPDPFTGLAQISAIYLVALLVGMAATFGEAYLMMRTGQYAMFDLRRQLMTHLQRLDVAQYDRQPVGRMVTRVTTDIDALNEMFASGLVAILGDIFVILFLLGAMFRMSATMTLLLLAVMPLVVVTTLMFRKSVQSSYRRIRIAVARINSYLQEHVTGISVLQLFNREDRSKEEFEKLNREHMEAYKNAIFAYGWFYPVVEFLGMLALAALLAWGGYQVDRGAITLGALIAFFQYGLRFFRPIQDLSEKYNILQAAMAASERVFQLLDTPVTITAPARRHTATPVSTAAGNGAGDGEAAIEFDHVWFAYKDEEWVLRDVSFRIAPGETIAVVGHTGAGKTTLTNLVLRFYDIQRGSIRVFGSDVRDFDPIVLRAHFGVVLQDPFLFTGDIASNIRLGTERISDAEIRRAAAQVNVLDYVEALPDGFTHAVRERGAGLSTGQKQLISFARALAHNPQILILDEATSSVDTDTEIRVREGLARLIEGRTSIIIAHRLSTIQRADRILVMHKGELRESGTHQELLGRRGIYWKLYQLQYKDQESRTGFSLSDPVINKTTT
jgi:ATP-binding cassette subfamily B protein